MSEFTLEVETIDGVADSDYLDRLAEVVSELDELVDPLLGLNENGSVSASFAIVAETASDAAGRGVALFAEALAEASTLRTLGEAAIGSHSVERTAIPSAS